MGLWARVLTISWCWDMEEAFDGPGADRPGVGSSQPLRRPSGWATSQVMVVTHWSPAGCSACGPSPGTAERLRDRTAMASSRLSPAAKRALTRRSHGCCWGRGRLSQADLREPERGDHRGHVNDYRDRLAERCTPLTAKRKTVKRKAAKRKAAGPPRYTDCRPPAGSDLDNAADRGIESIIAERRAAVAGSPTSRSWTASRPSCFKTSRARCPHSIRS